MNERRINVPEAVGQEASKQDGSKKAPEAKASKQEASKQDSDKKLPEAEALKRDSVKKLPETEALKRDSVKKSPETEASAAGASQRFSGNIRDVNSKAVFEDAVLCAQFLKDNLDIPLLKDIAPEDIEDVSERFQAYLGIEFAADTVKKIHIRNPEEGGEEVPLYLISLIEHKSQVDYNISMQLLRYMVCIWTEYGKEMEKKQAGTSKTKSFRYPPILPVVYYEGADNWTADLHLKSRIMMNEVFEECIPDFTYRLIKIHEYSNEELLSREDEMSLLMMINKVQTVQDMEEFLYTQRERVDRIVKRAPAHILEIIAVTIWGLCMKMKMSEEEARECVERVKERRMGYLFENMESFDIQIERMIERNKRETEQKAEKRVEAVKEAAKEAEKKAERTIISLCQKYGGTKEEAAEIFVKEYGLTQTEAEEKVKDYWK